MCVCLLHPLAHLHSCHISPDCIHDLAPRPLSSLYVLSGEDLTPYRAASKRILAVLSRFGPAERLGLDEVRYGRFLTHLHSKSGGGVDMTQRGWQLMRHLFMIAGVFGRHR